ncbi:TQO small subunit DoxD, partial [Legionella sp.]
MYNTRKFELLDWRIIGWIILSIRFVQGWIFWGGGSRRFIYDPHKLDPYAAQWMANKIQSAMPGALFDLTPVVSFLLHHFYFLYVAIIVFSLIELLSGLGLILGLFTRAAAMLTVMISILLMLLFGWQGSTCLDEWTMAVSNLSMGLTLILAGGSAYSIDAWLMKRYPNLVHKHWFLLFNSGPWKLTTLRRTAISFFIFTILFTVGTYDYYRGAVWSRYRTGPVSADVFHLSLSDGQLDSKGSVRFRLNVDAGPSAVPSYIVRIELLDATKNIIETWSASQLGQLPATAIQNSYQYNKVDGGMYGLIAPESAEAVISLAPTNPLNLLSDYYTLQLYTVDGKR